LEGVFVFAFSLLMSNSPLFKGSTDGSRGGVEK
jgi:hypothetical protein